MRLGKKMQDEVRQHVNSLQQMDADSVSEWRVTRMQAATKTIVGYQAAALKCWQTAGQALL
jgi:hypothetical protein